MPHLPRLVAARPPADWRVIPGYVAHTVFGRWNLYRDLPGGGCEEIRKGIRTKREVRMLAERHRKGKKLPRRYSREYWDDVATGRNRFRRMCDRLHPLFL